MRGCTLVLVSTIILLPASGRGELAEFGPPPASAPFDEVDEATLQAEVTAEALAFLDRLQRHWGQGPDRDRKSVV